LEETIDPIRLSLEILIAEALVRSGRDRRWLTASIAAAVAGVADAQRAMAGEEYRDEVWLHLTSALEVSLENLVRRSVQRDEYEWAAELNRWLVLVGDGTAFDVAGTLATQHVDVAKATHDNSAADGSLAPRAGYSNTK